MKVEKINNGFVDDTGDVRPLADLTPDMEFTPYPNTFAASSVATRGLAKIHSASRRGGRSYEERSGREIGDAIQEALSLEEATLGRELTDAEVYDVSRRAELTARGIRSST